MRGMDGNWRFRLRDLFSTLAVVAVALALTRFLLSLVSRTDENRPAVA
jgi:hypothetical protein